MRIGALFAGYGGLEMGVQAALGGTVAWHSEIEPAACRILAHRYPGVPNVGDITAVDWATVEPVDVLTGGYPCQPFSHAGKRHGQKDERHLWPHMAEAIGQLRPSLVIAENVRGHLTLGFDEVVRDLGLLGYDASWCVVRAADVGAPHGRARVFIVGRNRHGCLRCRVDRRGGLHRDRGSRWQPPTSAEDQHGGQGTPGTDGDGAEVRGEGGRRGTGHRDDPSDRRVASERQGCCGDAAGRGAVAPGEEGNRPGGSGVPRHDRAARASSAQRSGDVDRRDASEVADLPGPDQGSEPSRTRSGPTCRSAWSGTSGDVSLGALVGAAGEPVRPGGVRGPMADVGGDGGRGCLCAADVGAPHGRFRVFVVAWPAADAGVGPLAGPAAAGDGLRDPAERGGAAADAGDHRRGRGAQLDGATPAQVDGEHRGHPDRRGHGPDWGPYAAAVARWERILGRPAPNPTEPGRTGPRLSPRFVEWMMGLPAGWVTDVPGVTRNAQLKALGNGVVPQQAEAALRWLLGDASLPSLPSLPTPTTDDSFGSRGRNGFDAAFLLPTPEASDGSGGRRDAEMGGTRPSGSKRAITIATAVHHLLPTPAVNDMGAGKTPADWDAWTGAMKAKHGNGNGHGNSLAVEAQRLGGTP